MRRFAAYFVPASVVFSLGLTAQSGLDTPGTQLPAPGPNSVTVAQDQLRRIASLVEMGALPRVRLAQAQRDLDDAQDEAVLDRSLYGKVTVQGLTEELANEMVAAAQRRVDREQERIKDANAMVDDGIVAKNSVAPLQDEMNLRQMALNLAKQRAQLFSALAAMARSEHELESASIGAGIFAGGMQHFEGSGVFNEAKQLRPIELEFARKFDKPLPISADGETAVHRALGFDHRGRVDVAVNPEQKEGQWLMGYLKSRNIPFYAFTHAIPGKATGAHIHIGPGSTRLLNAD